MIPMPRPLPTPSGNFSYDGYAPDSGDIGARYHLTAVGESSGYQAQTIFGDGINAIDFSNPPLDQNTGACGELTLTVGGSAPYGDIYFTDSTTTGAFYSDSGCTTALPTASYQLYPGGPTYVDPYIAGAATVTVYYSNTTAGNPQLTACASEDPYACYIPPRTARRRQIKPKLFSDHCSGGRRSQAAAHRAWRLRRSRK